MARVFQELKRADFTYDRTGRLTLQKDFEANGSTVAHERTISYNAKGQIDSDTAITLRSNTSYRSITTNQYGSGTGYALGAVTSATTANAERVGSGSWTTKPSSSTTNAYLWRDGALIQTVTNDTDTGSGSNPVWTTNYSYNRRNDLTLADINDGRPRDVTYVTDLNGQIIRRDEADANTATGDPHERTYRFAGKQIGFVGNNGSTADFSYAASIADRQAPQGTGGFRNGATAGSSYADFDQGVSVINSYGQGSGAGVYTVRGGETLSSIAGDLWGDSSLWYKLAEANGLSGEAALAEGQTLVIPTGVLRSTHNANTFEPYDPNSAIGDTSPTNAKPPKKAKCGVFGQILLVVIAVAVTIATKGAAAKLFGFLGKLGSAVAGGALAGAAGSVVSQGVGLATGIQDKFSFKSVGLAAIGGAVGGGIGASSTVGNVLDSIGSKFVAGAVQAGVSSAITQGVGVATGLQAKFSFAGVAGAALGSGFSARFGDFGGGGFGGELAASTASGVINAATRSLINGTNFGDNLLAALPDIIGGTIGNAIGGEISGFGQYVADKFGLDDDSGGAEGLRYANLSNAGPLTRNDASNAIDGEITITLPKAFRDSFDYGYGAGRRFGEDAVANFAGLVDFLLRDTVGSIAYTINEGVDFVLPGDFANPYRPSADQFANTIRAAANGVGRVLSDRDGVLNDLVREFQAASASANALGTPFERGYASPEASLGLNLLTLFAGGIGAAAKLTSFSTLARSGQLPAAAAEVIQSAGLVLRNGLDLSKLPIFSVADAKKLGGVNRGLILVLESASSSRRGFAFESGATGAFSDILSQQRVVPALRFNHPSPNGNLTNNFVRFDGIDPDGITLIDRKLRLTTQSGQLADLRRVSSAAAQNPGFRVVYEFPTQALANSAARILARQEIGNISVRVAKN